MKKYIYTDELYSKLMTLVSLDTGKKKDLYERIGIPKHKCQAILYRQVRYISSDLLDKFEEYFHVNLHQYLVEDNEKDIAITQYIDKINKLQYEVDKLHAQIISLNKTINTLNIRNY